MEAAQIPSPCAPSYFPSAGYTKIPSCVLSTIMLRCVAVASVDIADYKPAQIHSNILDSSNLQVLLLAWHSLLTSSDHGWTKQYW